MVGNSAGVFPALSHLLQLLFRSELLTERRNRFFGAYMTRAKQKMAITINEDIVKKVVGT